MPTITLTITDTQARVLTALEQIDTLTVDERFAPYLRDIVNNGAGVRGEDEERILAAVLALEADAHDAEAQRVAVAEQVQLELPMPEEEPPVADPADTTPNIVEESPAVTAADA